MKEARPFKRYEVSRLYFTGKKKAVCHSFLSTSKHFLYAAEIITDKYLSKRFYPEPAKVIYYLIGHSLELCLKSFLHYKGRSVDELKNKFRHNLKKCLTASKQNGLNILDKHEENAIIELNSYFEYKIVGYEETDFKLITPFVYFDIGHKLIKEIKKTIGVIGV
jgi:hypothetical protein